MTKIINCKGKIKIYGFEYQCPSCKGYTKSPFTLNWRELDTRVIKDEHGNKKRIYLCPYFSQLI